MQKSTQKTTQKTPQMAASQAQVRFQKELEWVLGQLLQQDYRASTLAGYRRNLTRLNREIPGGLLQEPAIMHTCLQQWREQQQQLITLKKTDPKRGVTKSKVTCDRAALSTFYTTLVSRRRYPENPVADVNGAGRERGMPHPIPVHSFAKVVAQIATQDLDGLRDRMVCELFMHGLRSSEVCWLSTSDLAVEHGEAQTFRLRVEQKGGDDRLVYLSPSSLECMCRYLMARFAPDERASWEEAVRAEQPTVDEQTLWRRLGERVIEETFAAPATRPSTRQATRPSAGQSVPLFVTATGLRLTNNWNNRMWRRYATAAGISDEWSPHACRHRCATELLTQGHDIRKVQSWMGHADIRSTTIYADVVPEVKIAMSRTLPAISFSDPLPTEATV